MAYLSRSLSNCCIANGRKYIRDRRTNWVTLLEGNWLRVQCVYVCSSVRAPNLGLYFAYVERCQTHTVILLFIVQGLNHVISICRLTYEARLFVKNVSREDYGSYDCVAQNVEGWDRFTVRLNVTSHPDPASYLRVLSLGYNSVNLSWTPGFDGGYEQKFKIRYAFVTSVYLHMVVLTYS